MVCRSKRDVITFFRGSGVDDAALADVSRRVDHDRQSISKREIANIVLVRLNQGGDPMLRWRREVIKRVVEFEDYAQCWPEDQDKARGLVSRVRGLVDQRYAFTRMKQERDREVADKRSSIRSELERKGRKREALAHIRDEMASLFGAQEPHERGRRFEKVVNDLFRENDILVREAFSRVGNPGEGVVEQLDGAVELDGHLFLVEAKWWKGPVGPVEVRDLLSRVYARADARGLFISASTYTAAAVNACQQALGHRVVTLTTLEEVLQVLETEGDYVDFLRRKVRAAQLDMEPFASVLPTA